MATSEDNIILKIDVEYDAALKNINNYREQIAELMKLQEQYRDDVKKGKDVSEEDALAYERREVQVRNLKTEMRQFQKEMDNNFKNERAIQQQREGSLVQLRAQLSNVTRAYDELSREEREAAKGKELQKSINDITNELKEAEAETTRYYRNVGNYENSIQNALGANSKWFQSLKSIQDITAGGLKNALTTATSAVGAFGKQLLSLLANPIVAILAAIAGAIMLVVKAIKSSEDNTNAMKMLLAPLQRLLTAVLNVIQDIVAGILSWVQNGAKLVGWIMTMMEKLPVIGKLLKIINNEIRESIKIAATDAQLAKERREIDEKNADDQVKIAKLQKKANADRHKDRKQQMEDLKEIDALQEGIAKREMEYRRKDYENYKAQREWSHNTKEENDELTAKYVAMRQAEAEYYQKTARTAGQLAAAEESFAKGVTATGNAASDAAQRIAEMKKKELDAVRSAEDTMTRIIRDEYKRRRQEIDLQFQRRIEDLETRLNTEAKDLTANAKKAIQDEIEATRVEWAQQISQWNEDRLKNAIENEQKRLTWLLEAAKGNVLKSREIELDQIDYEQVIEEKRLQQEITNEKTREEMLDALREAYRAKRIAVEKKYDEQMWQERTERIQKEFETLIEDAGKNELEVARLQMEEKKAILDAAQIMEGESIEQWNERKLQMQRDYNKAAKVLAEKEVEIEQAKYKAIGSAIGALSDLMEESADENKAIAIASKVLALAEIAINSGVAIAAGIKQAQSVPYPANLAAMATTVAQILAGITSAIKTVKSAKFAMGGTVFGAGTKTSDSINARLSNGESVLTADATSLFSPILSAMNQLGGGVPIIATTPQTQMGEDMIAAAVAKGMQMAPRPVVSVQEINNVQKRVEVIERIAKV